MNLDVAMARRRARRWLVKRIGRQRMLDSRLLQRALGYASTGSSVIDRVDGRTIEYDISSDVGMRLFTSGLFETDEISFFTRIVRDAPPAPVILDIGANVGLHTLAWAAARPDARVFAFEPSRATAATLERNVVRNELEGRVEIVRAAVSDRIGVATFHECADNAYSSLKDTGRKTVTSTVQVPTITLDSFVRERGLASIALLKIDVEGFETEVVAGAVETLRSQGPDLFVEIYGGERSNPDPGKTVELVRSLGYRAYVFDGSRLVPFERHDDTKYNYYFSRRSNTASI